MKPDLSNPDWIQNGITPSGAKRFYNEKLDQVAIKRKTKIDLYHDRYNGTIEYLAYCYSECTSFDN